MPLMRAPRASRPYMPDYGFRGPDEGSGLLPWSWAEERLTESRNVAVDPRCVVATEDANEPVIVEGRAELAHERDTRAVAVVWRAQAPCSYSSCRFHHW